MAPTAWWRLNEPSGSVANDSSGNGRDGTYHGSVRLADRHGPCVGVNYVGAPGAGLSYVAQMPDDSVWSTPNDLTIVYSVSFKNAITAGASLAQFGPINKGGEWFVSMPGQHLEIGQTNTSSSNYRSWVQSSTVPFVGGPWRLIIVRMPVGSAMTVRVDSSDPASSSATSGPTGTRRGDTTGVLTLGGTGIDTIVSPGPTKGRFLSNVATFDRILDSTECADLWTAFQADGWHTV